jgi:hypothetical protein
MTRERKAPGRIPTPAELERNRKGGAATKLPPELKRTVRTRLTPGEWAMVQQLRVQTKAAR